MYGVCRPAVATSELNGYSPRDSTGFLSPGGGSEGSSTRDALLTTECCHWFVHSSTMSYSSACNLVHIGDLDDSLHVGWSLMY